tara:strand:+ start:218 stop:436 length:219 start_codon:yes stop_codon:yes gene_type:complete
MKRLLLAPLCLSLLSPAAYASEKDFKVKDTCARVTIGVINGKEAMKRLNLPLRNATSGDHKAYAQWYCRAYK